MNPPPIDFSIPKEGTISESVILSPDTKIIKTCEERAIVKDKPDYIFECLTYYFEDNEFSYTYEELINPDTNEIKLIELKLNKTPYGLINKISISNSFEVSERVNGQLYINRFNDFLLLYHESYSKHKLKQFSTLEVMEKSPVISYILQKIDILNHYDYKCGLIGFYDNSAFYISDCIQVYCHHFGIKINNYMELDFGKYDPKTICIGVLDSRKLAGIKTIFIDKKFKKNRYVPETRTIYINSFYFFLYYSNNLMKFLKYQIEIQ